MSRVRYGVTSLGLTLLAACASWHPVSDETVRQGSAQSYDHLLVVTRDGREIELGSAVIGPDSIRGTALGDHAGDRVALGHNEVARVESADASALATAQAVGGLVVDATAEFLRLIGRLVGCIITRGRIC
jgi:hypothetical protein